MASLLPRWSNLTNSLRSFSASPSPVSVRRLIELCPSTCHLLQVHARLTALALFPSWCPKLLRRASQLRDLCYTVKLFRSVDSPGVFCVNNVIEAFRASSAPEGAFGVAAGGGLSPNSYTFVSLIGVYAKMGWLGPGMMCHGQAVTRGLSGVLPVQNSLVHFYGCCGAVELARKVFDEMAVRDLITCNSILTVYVRAGELRLAHKLFDSMPERNVVSWNVMISGYLKGNNPGSALMVFRKMVASGLRGNDRTMASVVSACGRSGRVREGQSVHGYLVRSSSGFNLIVCTSLIDMYSKCSKVEAACIIFERMLTRNLVSWNAMILGHCIHGNPVEGLRLFGEMTESSRPGCRGSIAPDDVTYIGVLCGCARLGLFSEGNNFFRQMIREHRIKPNFAHYWCMANLYVGMGLVRAAEDLIRNSTEAGGNFSTESLVWANLLAQCRFNGDATLAVRIAKSLINAEPSNFSHYHLLANIYSAVGQWDEVESVKKMMKEREMRKVPGLGLVDLKCIVHDYKTGHAWLEDMHEVGLGVVNERVE